jgi:hypothetical protein
LHATLLLHATLVRFELRSSMALTMRRNCWWILTNIETQQLSMG